MKQKKFTNFMARVIIGVGVYWLIRWLGLEAGFAIIVYFLLKIVDDKA